MSYWAEIEANRRLLAGEIGVVTREWGGRLPIALIYPNRYAVGMASLGFQTVYRFWNQRRDVFCERAFFDDRWDDSPAPRSIESQRRLDEFAVWAFSLAFELDYLNAVNLLRRSGMPALAAEREDADPIVIAGGPAVSANPQPLAPLFDAFVIGEAEELLDGVAAVLAAQWGERRRVLSCLAEIPGVYVPQYLPVGGRVRRQWVRDLDRYSTRTVIWTRAAEFGDMHLVEVSRGCRRGCRFCLAGYTTRPWRERSPQVVLEAAREGLAHRRQVGLVGAAVSDYSQIDEVVAKLLEMGATISVSSLRAEGVSPALLDALARSRAQTLTLAPEAGTARLRSVIGKGVSEAGLLRTVEEASRRGFATLKLYFMVGLPTETDEDIEGLIALTARAAQRFPRQVSVNLEPFVPKAHTPFQWEAATDLSTLKRRLRLAERGLRAKGVRVRSDSVEWAEVQGVLARGDERLAGALLALRRPALSEWKAALHTAGVKTEEFTRQRKFEEALPWSVVESGVRPAFLARLAEEAREGDSPSACAGGKCMTCGVCG